MLKDKENAVLVGIITQNQRDREVQEYLDELSFLTETAGAEEVKRFVQKLEHPHPKTFVGTGKLNEIAGYIKENKINLLIFDDELSPSQLRNIENIVSCKVLDRTNLILDIFAQRAKTAHSKIQVELAQYQYLLPRLTRMWTHLERQQGGIGMRGPGETEIETDRRVIRDKISYLKEQLKQIDKQMATQRKTRNELPRVALIGYTNVGKSTIMNMLSKSDVFAENKLFATLDTTVRKVVIETTPFLLSDTVGFIRKLPHNLVESFKSTLDEARESDILLHVVDISHSNFEDQIHVVNQTLLDINVKEKPTLLVFNKIDAYSFVKKDEDDLSPATDENMSLEQLKNSWMAKNNNPCIFISAKNKSNIDIFRSQLLEMITKVNLRK
ncbi:MAG: GTPase HflX [Bacteroidetes bacterium RIFOXYA12_FULL_35_11]|nr:MAG: GTPase HflX [Bacteroidetes bacterium GWF2_35_48]OFY75220.1 MAG: GTPase HflX [Bacteroidetes bacterium RIFOXYA12_FULL_35_11]OFY97004.1 MAG: GTPase HflX [Bacteroidetes bacterium RIFOXYC12_FULL_35_7]